MTDTTHHSPVIMISFYADELVCFHCVIISVKKSLQPRLVMFKLAGNLRFIWKHISRSRNHTGEQ